MNNINKISIASFAIIASLAFGNTNPEKPKPKDECEKLVGGQSKKLITNEAIKTYGAGEVRYINGRAVSTNRRLLRSYWKSSMFSKVRDVVNERTKPVPFPSYSHSKFSLIKNNIGQVFLRIDEFWDLMQGFTKNNVTPDDKDEPGYLGEGGFSFDHVLPVEFTLGSWEIYESGRPVKFKVTHEGALKASLDLQESVSLSTVLKSKPKTLEAGIHITGILSGMTSEFLSTLEIPEEQKSALIDEALDVAKKMTEDESSNHKVVSATSELPIELDGTKTDMTVRYLSDVTIHAIGNLYIENY